MNTSEAEEKLFRDFQRYVQRRKQWRRRRWPLDPFVLLERGIAGVLRALEQSVERLVRWLFV